MGKQREVALGKFEEQALYFMKQRSDGDQIGHMVRAGDQSAEDWWKYFVHKGMQKKAQYMAARLREGKEYMVPCENVLDFDPTYRSPNTARKPYNDD